MSQNKRQSSSKKTTEAQSTHVKAIDDAMVKKAMEDPNFLEKAMNRLPPEVIAVAASRMTMHSGPLPDPDTLNRYNQVVPGAADRIMNMAEGEQRHRHTTDHKRINHDFIIKLVGQIFGLVSVGGTLGLSGVLAYLGHPGAAATIAGTVTASLAAVFVLGQKYKAKQDAARGNQGDSE